MTADVIELNSRSAKALRRDAAQHFAQADEYRRLADEHDQAGTESERRADELEQAES